MAEASFDFQMADRQIRRILALTLHVRTTTSYAQPASLWKYSQ
jgi:hypothetical protein